MAAALLLLIVLIALSAFRITQINKRWPDPEIRTYSLGKEIMGGDIGITATDARLVEGKEILEIIPEFELEAFSWSNEPIGIEDFKILLVDVTVRNTGADSREVLLHHFSAQSQAWSNAIDLQIFHSINEDTGLNLSLPANSAMNVRLPYLLCTPQFRDWETAGKRHFDLVLSIYPIKCSVRVM